MKNDKQEKTMMTPFRIVRKAVEVDFQCSYRDSETNLRCNQDCHNNEIEHTALMNDGIHEVVWWNNDAEDNQEIESCRFPRIDWQALPGPRIDWQALPGVLEMLEKIFNGPRWLTPPKGHLLRLPVEMTYRIDWSGYASMVSAQAEMPTAWFVLGNGTDGKEAHANLLEHALATYSSRDWSHRLKKSQLT